MFERPPPVVMELAPHDSAPGRARRVVRDLLGPDSDSEFARDAILLTSEIVSNAAMIGAACELSAWYLPEAGTLRVEVFDQSPEMPSLPRPKSSTDISGRGLMIVESIASRWGVDPADNGKYVWFELSRGDVRADSSPVTL